MSQEDNPASGKPYLDAMTALSAAVHEQTMQAMSRAEETVVEVFDAWAQSTLRLTAAPPPATVEQLLKPREMIDRGFDLAEQMLKAQHTLARTVLRAVEHQLDETAGTTSSTPGADTADSESASQKDAATDDTGDSGGLGQAIKNVFRGTSEEDS